VLLSGRDKLKLRIQCLMGLLFIFPLCFLFILLMRVRYRLKIKDHSQVRERFKELVKTDRPLLICANHLTLVDSIILIWALAHPGWYFFNYRRFPWNLPAVENFSTKLGWRIAAYLGKCLPIDRAGSAEHHDLILEKTRYLLRRGDTCMIFPEGTRSRTGQIEVENVTYGIGKIIKGVPDCAVLCVYMRGEKQDTYTDFPEPGDSFEVNMEMIFPSSEKKGLREIKDYSVQVISKLRVIEENYFHSTRLQNDANLPR